MLLKANLESRQYAVGSVQYAVRSMRWADYCRYIAPRQMIGRHQSQALLYSEKKCV